VKEGEAKAAQWIIGPVDFVADDDEAERHAFELARRLSEVEAEAAQLREYEQW
jgi:RecB family endonuclease NucS